MNHEQLIALNQLDKALAIATNCGALDLLYDHCKSPDSINDVCDGVEEILNTKSFSVSMQMEDGQTFNWSGLADDSLHAEGLAIAAATSKTGEQVFQVNEVIEKPITDQLATAISLLEKSKLLFKAIEGSDKFCVVSDKVDIEEMTAAEIIKYLDFDQSVSNYKVTWVDGFILQPEIGNTEIKTIDYFTGDIDNGFDEYLIKSVKNLNAGEVFNYREVTTHIKIQCINKV